MHTQDKVALVIVGVWMAWGLVYGLLERRRLGVPQSLHNWLLMILVGPFVAIMNTLTKIRL